MNKQPKHRPRRNFPKARRVIVECEPEKCIHLWGAIGVQQDVAYEKECTDDGRSIVRGGQEQEMYQSEV